MSLWQVLGTVTGGMSFPTHAEPNRRETVTIEVSYKYDAVNETYTIEANRGTVCVGSETRDTITAAIAFGRTMLREFGKVMSDPDPQWLHDEAAVKAIADRNGYTNEFLNYIG